MNQRSDFRPGPRRVPTWLVAGVGLLLAVAGCGSSDPVRELPEAARKSLTQRKVDAQPKAATRNPARR